MSLSLFKFSYKVNVKTKRKEKINAKFVTMKIKAKIKSLMNTCNLDSLAFKFLNSRVTNVVHNDIRILFNTPNWITRYRAETFSTKEPETLQWIDSFDEGSVFWDVGANVGLYSIYASKSKNIRTFAFEPSVFNLELLAKNIFINGLNSNIVVMPIALNDKIGQSLFKMSSTIWGGALSTFGQDFNQYGDKLQTNFEYRTMGLSMDEAYDLFSIPMPRYVKIDVDGLEHFILRGGSRVLKQVESVLVEIDDCFKVQAEETARSLSAAGLTLKDKYSIPGSGAQFNQYWVRI